MASVRAQAIHLFPLPGIAAEPADAGENSLAFFVSVSGLFCMFT
jgi:hypothetical protein